MTGTAACTRHTGVLTALSLYMAVLLASMPASASGDVCAEGRLRRDVESASGARGGAACDRVVAHGLEMSRGVLRGSR
jgi:hypothetical protein